MSPEEMELQRIKDSIFRMQEEMNMLQQQFYQKSSGGGTTKGRPAVAAEFMDIEEKMRQLNGKVEELNYRVEVLQKKNDELTSQFYENLARINNILEQNHLTNNVSQGAQPIVSSPAAPAVAAPKVNEENNDNDLKNTDIILEKGPSGSPIVEDKDESSIEQKDEKYESRLPKGPGEAPLKPAEQYEQAFQLLRQSKYIEAQAALETFIKENPKNPLVENSYYWLGETFYKREEFNQAAVNFMKGYQAFPKGNKSIDNLYKLALSLEKLDKKKEACTTLKKLGTEFPTLSAENKSRVDAEKKQLGCTS